MILLACTTEPLELHARTTAAGVAVTATAPVDRVEIHSEAGILVASRSLVSPSVTVEVVSPLPAGRYRVTGRADERSAVAELAVVERPPVLVEVQPSPGQPWRVVDGDVDVPLFAGSRAEVLVGVTAGAGHPQDVSFEPGEPVALHVEGHREVRVVPVAREPVVVTVGERSFTLRPRPLDDVHVTLEADFPCSADGSPEVGRPPSRIPIPGRAVERALRAVRLSSRARDAWSPWAWQGVTLTADAADPLDVVVSLEVERDGRPVDAFRPRLRAQDGDTGVVSVLVRIPAGGSARAALPVFVDTAAVEEGPNDLVLTVRPLGADRALLTHRETLIVSRGDPVAGSGFVLSIGATLAGIAWTARRLHGWLEASATSELMTIALFGSSLFLVGTASDLLAMGVGALLGPFSTIITGLVSDVGRYTLLSTLVTLLPRPGTLCLAVLTGWFLRGFSTGTFTPVDVLYTGSAIAFCEGFAWLAGLTRGGAWRDETLSRRWLRLSVGFAGASVLTTLCGLWLHVVLFRLFFADWYIALQVLGPGLLYTVLACRIGADFASSLRRVAS